MGSTLKVESILRLGKKKKCRSYEISVENADGCFVKSHRDEIELFIVPKGTSRMLVKRFSTNIASLRDEKTVTLLVISYILFNLELDFYCMLQFCGC